MFGGRSKNKRIVAMRSSNGVSITKYKELIVLLMSVARRKRMENQ